MIKTPAARMVHLADPRYAEIVEHLYYEAELLDTTQFEVWLGLLTEDLEYRMPARLNVRDRTNPGFSATTDIFADNLASLTVRIHRLRTNFAWSEDPPSRTRHLITNVRVQETETPLELSVRSNFLLYRTRAEQTEPDLFAGERQDTFRSVEGAWRLARRLILLDQTIVNARHLSIIF
jgi:ethylbenzene dioxygenase beta subunit